jgi:hypothetical protein
VCSGPGRGNAHTIPSGEDGLLTMKTVPTRFQPFVLFVGFITMAKKCKNVKPVARHNSSDPKRFFTFLYKNTGL